MYLNDERPSSDELPMFEAKEQRAERPPPRSMKRALYSIVLYVSISAILFHFFFFSRVQDLSYHRGSGQAQQPVLTDSEFVPLQPWRIDDKSKECSENRNSWNKESSSPRHRSKHHRNHGAHKGAHNHSLVHQLSDKILASVSPEHIRAYAEHYFLAGPHLSAQNEALANWTREEFESHGLDAHTEIYNIWTNYPISHRVALLDSKTGEPAFELSLEEPVLEEDLTTGDPRRIPTFHGYSASGNATGKFIYANLGRKQDYDRLVDEGIDLTDKIVIVRYGGLFRGLKVKFAEQLGASAVLIYSDPAEDGEITVENGYEAYPRGPARHPESVQRGSVQDLSHAPGDPTTPGFPSTPDNEANRTTPNGIPGIPSVPISYADAIPLLRELNGKGPTFDDWKGALSGISYSVGPSHTEVVVENSQDYDFRPNRDVIATFEGQTQDTVIVGNHRDAWIIGAADPNSGSAVLLELARVLGELVSQGWKPKRTIVLASWDGEEYGLLGSTEWGEDHASELRKNAVAYLNIDSAVSGGSFGVSGNPLLRESIEYAAHKTPFGNSTLSEHWGGDADTRIHHLGSGSDYTVFQDYLGIPSLDAGFHGNTTSPVYHYHSNYDSWHWMTEYGDPDFERHSAAAKFLALTLVDIVESPQTPFSVVNYAKVIKRELKALLKNYEGPAVEEVGALFGEVYRFLHASKRFTAKAKKLERQINHFESHWWNTPKWLLLLWKQKDLNEKMKNLDRAFVYEPGLEDRPWFKHLIYAPGRYTGYAGQVFPGIAESLEDGDEKRLLKWVEIITEALHEAAGIIS